MKTKEISNVIGFRFVGKVGKYIVKLGFPEEKAKEIWMTERQLDNLLFNFGKTPKGYSTKKVSVVAVFNDNGYYAYSTIYIAPWEPPRQYDLSDLEDT